MATRRARWVAATLAALLVASVGLGSVPAGAQSTCPVDPAIPPPPDFPVDLIAPGTKFDDAFRELFIAGITARFLPDPLPPEVATGDMYVLQSGFVSEVPEGATAPVTVPVVCVGTKVPAVEGSTVASARTLLTEVGLRAGGQGASTAVVVGQRPAAGEIVPFETVIVLDVPAPEPVESDEDRSWMWPLVIAGAMALGGLAVVLLVRAARRRERRDAQQRIGTRPVAGPMTAEVQVSDGRPPAATVGLVLHQDAGTQRIEEPTRR